MEENKVPETPKETPTTENQETSSSNANTSTGEQAAASVSNADVKVKENLINLTIKTPKDKENVSVEASATVKEVIRFDEESFFLEKF